MNNVQRRLFRAFVEGGGDMTDSSQVDRLIRHVDIQVTLMPPRVKAAMELVLRANDEVSYAQVAIELSGREGSRVSTTAIRQRVARGMRALVPVLVQVKGVGARLAARAR